MTFVATLALWLVAISGFNAVFAKHGWVAPVVAAVVLPLAVERLIPTIRRARPTWSPRLLRIAAIAVHVVLFLAVIGWALYPDTLLLVVPTPSTVWALVHGFGSGMSLARESVPPIDVAPPFVAIATASVWWCAAASGAGQWSSASPALSTAPPVTIYVATAILSQGNAGAAPLWLLVVLVGLCILAADYSRRGTSWMRALPAAAACTGVLAAAAFVAPLTPKYGEPELLDFRNQVGTEISDNPLVDIKPRVLHQSPEILFTVESPDQQYWRFTSLDVYADGKWSAGQNPPVLPAASANRTRPATQEVQILDLRSPWLPVAPYPTTPPDTTDIDAATQSVVVQAKTRNNVTYEVISSIPRVDATSVDSVAGADADNPDVAHYLEHPPLSDGVRAWIEDSVASAKSPYAKASALTSRLKTFRYDVTVPPGHGVDELDRFLLETRAGYCEQFAAALALAARAVGIPSRVAVGYLPGEAVRLGKQGRTVYQVRNRDSHAWTELWFPGWGWLRFDATPRGDNAVDAPPLAAGQPETQPAPPTSAAVPDGTQPSDTTIPPTTVTSPGRGALDGLPAPVRGALQLLGLVVAAAALWIGAVVAAKRLRTKRRRALGATGLWAEARDFVTDLGGGPGPATTAAELAQEGRRLGVKLDALVADYESAAFGPPGSGESDTALRRAWTELDMLRRDIARRNRMQWVRVMLSARSLRPGRRRQARPSGSAAAAGATREKVASGSRED